MNEHAGWERLGGGTLRRTGEHEMRGHADGFR